MVIYSEKTPYTLGIYHEDIEQVIHKNTSALSNLF